MDGKLRVDYEGLENDTIVRLKNCERRISDTYEQMYSQVSSLRQYMEAKAAEAYINEFTELVGPSIESMETIVNEYYTQLQQIATRFAEVDDKLSQSISAR